MGVSKVIINGVTRVDLTQDTVASNNLLAGETATGADGEAVEGAIASKASTDLTVSGATVTAPAGFYSAAASKSVATTTHPNPTASINSSTGVVTASHTQTTGYVTGGTTTGTLNLTTQAATTVTPTESEQTVVAAGRYTTGAVKVGAISSTYVGSGITRRTYNDMTVNGAQVIAPAGYYANASAKSVATGSAATPTTTITANPDISVSPSGVVTATVSASQSITPTVSAGYVSNGTSGTVTVSGSDTLQLSVQASKVVTPSTSSQTAVAAGKYTTGTVTVAAMPTGTAGTPTATKGTVSNHSVTVTPSVTNTTGYITGGTETGTAVTVTAAELDSGTKTITENGTGIDVIGYSAVDVNVESVASGYAATITQQSGMNTQWVTYDGKNYSSDGDVFQFNPGDVLTLVCKNNSIRISINDEIMAQQNSQDAIHVTYDYTLPEDDITIIFSGNRVSSYIDVYTVHPVVESLTITTNGTYQESYKAYSPVTVNVYQTTEVPLTITQNGTYTAPSGTAYTPVIVDVSGGGSTAAEKKDINFIDYDGTILYSYTPTEFAELTALPLNPGHAGLIAQGWNWSLSDAQAYVAKYGMLTIGQMYVTASGATEIDITLTAPDLSPTLFICPNGTVTIDWGDNSSTNTITGTSITTAKTASHEYTTAGEYTIKLTVINGEFGFYTGSSGAYVSVLRDGTSLQSRRYSLAITAIRLGANVSIRNYAFANCANLTSITIPNSVTSIGTYAFLRDRCLVSITIPNSVISIEASTWYECKDLKTLSIPNGVTSIGSSAFESCNSLITVTIPEGVTSINNSTFRECRALTSVIIPNGVTSIGSGAFAYASCESLIIPNGVTNIGSYAFNYCYFLTSIIIPDSVTSIDGSAFSGCNNLKSIIIPDGITQISSYLVSSCERLTTITIPDSVTSIGTYAFYNCFALKSVIIPDGVTSIPTYMCNYCYSIKSITIPANVTSIGTYAFANCTYLSEIHFLPDTPPTLANTNAFSSVPATCKFYVPTGSLEAYKTATNWSTYASRMQEE